MTTQNKKRDDELKVWIIVGAIFTIFLLIIDFFYSSVNSMAFVARMVIWIGHAALSLGWIISIAKVADPAYDDVRKGVVYLCMVLSLIIGIHHATTVEDKQVIEDSEKNKTSYLIKSKWELNRYLIGAPYKIRLYEMSKDEAAIIYTNSSLFVFGNCAYCSWAHKS